jgi:hypothetical protein
MAQQSAEFWESGTPWHERASLLFKVIMFVTVLQRFAVPGTKGIVGVGFVLSFGVAALGVTTGTLRISPARFAFYTFSMAGLLFTLLIKTEPYSPSSFLMLAVMYMPFTAVMPVAPNEYRWGLDIFQRVMSVLAWCGLAQMAFQFVLGPGAMFPLDLILPKSFFISGFHLEIPIIGTTGYLKSNGLVFLEPSHFSQFLALSIIVELLYFKRFERLILLAAAYLTSFSGTGLVLMAIVMLPLILRNRLYWILAVLAILVIIAPILHDVPPFSLFFDRLSEFSNPMSSGSMRFFGPYWFTGDVLFTHPDKLIFGYGPGTVADVMKQVDYDVQDSSWVKLIVEYGLIGTAAFLPFYIYVLFARSGDRLLSFACLVQFLMLGGFLNSFYIQFLHLCLVGWPVVTSIHTRPRMDAGAGRRMLWPSQ